MKTIVGHCPQEPGWYWYYDSPEAEAQMAFCRTTAEGAVHVFDAEAFGAERPQTVNWLAQDDVGPSAVFVGPIVPEPPSKVRLKDDWYKHR